MIDLRSAGSPARTAEHVVCLHGRVLPIWLE
jgi:hypothetical protein